MPGIVEWAYQKCIRVVVRMRERESRTGRRFDVNLIPLPVCERTVERICPRNVGDGKSKSHETSGCGLLRDRL